MRRHNWRWLWIWVGVLAAGCGQGWSSDGAPAPTREPTRPLLGYTLLPPVTPTLWPVYTATPLITADSSVFGVSPVMVYLAITGSECYETPVGSLICLGLVSNQWDQPVEQVRVAVQLVAYDGTPLATKEVLVSRWVLPGGAAGPYRVLFERLPEGYAEAQSFIIAGQPSATTDSRYANLVLQPVTGAFVLDHYQVSLTVVNRDTRPVEQITITMTLLDRNGQVTGFRQVPLEATRRLAPGESLAMTIRVIPQGVDTVAYQAFAEGFFVLNN